MKHLICTFALLFLLGIPNAPATDYYVDADRPDDTGSGLSWATAKKTIQAAVNLTTNGDTVLVEDGNYNSGATVTPGYTVSNRVYISTAIELRSMNGPDHTAIVGAPATGGGIGADAVRGMYVSVSGASIIGFTFTNGYASTASYYKNSYGGGFCMADEQSVVVSNCHFFGNSAHGGGGAFCEGSIYDCRFEGNTATGDGGGMRGDYHAYDCHFFDNYAADYGGGSSGGTSRRCTFLNNRANQSGGGMINGIANDCTFTGNWANWHGGGKHYGAANYCNFVSNSAQYGGGAFEGTANHCTFTNNTASNVGGGMHEGQASYCTFYGNSANQYGGGMGAYPFSSSSAGWADHCTFSHNSANNSGGGMYQGTAKNCSFTLNTAYYGGGIRNTKANNCLVAGNSARNGGGTYSSTLNNCTVSGNHAEYDGGGAYQGTANNSIIWYNSALRNGNNLYNGTVLNYSCAPDAVHGSNGCITNAPLLISNSHLATNSPCIGAGSATYGSATDLDDDAWLSPPAMGCDQPDGLFNGWMTLALSETPAHLLIGREIVATGFVQGKASSFKLDFGNGHVVWNTLTPVSNVWNSAGVYTVRLTAYNDDYPAGISVPRTITVATPEQAIIHVAPGGNDAHSGDSWATAKATLQAGVDAQLYAGGSVLLTNGTHLLTEEVNVDKEIIITSLNGPGVTSVDGGGTTRCFDLNDSPCILSSITITNGFVDNDSGGGIYCNNTTPIVSNCVITANTITYEYGYGGGMYYGTAIDCIFSNNRAEEDPEEESGGYGGAIYQSRAYTCLFTGNFANRYGGAAYEATLNNCTVSGNSSTYRGGGVSGGDITNCIIWYNTADSGDNDLYDGYVSHSSSPDLTHGEDNCITNAPLFVDKGAGNYQLTPDSPCIDTGWNGAVSTATDLAGHPRVQYGTVDMGAYEWTAPPTWLAKSTDQIPAPVAIGNAGPDKTFEVWNKGNASMSYAISDNVSWLDVSPTVGNSTGEQDTCTVSFDTAGLALGSYTGTITIASAEAPNAPQTIEVPLNVYTPQLSYFDFSSIGGSQTVGSPINLSLFARDANGYTVPSFSDTVQLTGQIPGVVPAELTIGSDPDTSWHPMPARNEVARSQFIYLRSEMGEARRISSLELNVIEIPGRTMNNWTIRMRHTDLDDYSVSENWESDWTTLYQSDLTVTSTGWVAFAFNTPFEYNGTDHLMVDFSFRNTSTAGDMGYCEASESLTPRGLSNRGYDDYGDPLDWSGPSDPSPDKEYYIPNLKLDTFIAAPVSISPTQSENFVEGIWSGSITVQEVALNLFLLADDENGHTGKSDLFNCLADTDSDGIPDYWELEYFGGETNANPNAMAANGINTVRDCYIADLDPGNSGERFIITDFTGTEIRFNSSSNRIYHLLWRTNLVDGTWIPITDPRTGTGGPDTLTGSTEAPFGYYRLEVMP